MGGNGFYWRIAFHPSRDGVLEVRRSEGVRSWDAAPGTYHLSFTGERGGLWRHSGRAPQMLVGVGFVGQGFDRSSYYRRTEASRTSRMSWAFEGIDHEILGAFGFIKGGAAGVEIDATDETLGTPAHAMVLARSEDHSALYESAVEDVLVPHRGTNGSFSPRIRAEVIFFETPNGGAVFSVGSVAFAGALGWNGHENDICRLATNVLRRFESPESWEPA